MFFLRKEIPPEADFPSEKHQGNTDFVFKNAFVEYKNDKISACGAHYVEKIPFVSKLIDQFTLFRKQDTCSKRDNCR